MTWRAGRGSGSVLSALLILAPVAGAQQTRAERTGFRETSSYAEVAAFLDSLARAGAPIRQGVLATSPLGRPVPYVVASRPLVEDPVEARRSGKPVLYIQGNIHGGDIEGKEAALMLLRDLSLGPLRPLLDSVVLLVVPIYNPDGNDAFAPGSRNRPGQNGPDLVGRRPNGMGLDLNRDYVKQEAPEMRGAAALINAWDPDLLLDLHTTNGSYHGYVLTYAPGLNPNRPPANQYLRDRFLPEVRRRMQHHHGQAMNDEFMASMPIYQKSLAYEVAEFTDSVYKTKYTLCLAAKILREMNAADIGYALVCSPANAFVKAFNPKMKSTFIKNLMKGDSVCIEQIVLEA